MYNFIRYDRMNTLIGKGAKTMSQAKVDRYKMKENRKKNMKKEKVQNIIRRCAVCVIAVA